MSASRQSTSRRRANALRVTRTGHPGTRRALLVLKNERVTTLSSENYISDDDHPIVPRGREGRTVAVHRSFVTAFAEMQRGMLEPISSQPHRWDSLRELVGKGGLPPEVLAIVTDTGGISDGAWAMVQPLMRAMAVPHPEPDRWHLEFMDERGNALVLPTELDDWDPAIPPSEEDLRTALISIQRLGWRPEVEEHIFDSTGDANPSEIRWQMISTCRFALAIEK